MASHDIWHGKISIRFLYNYKAQLNSNMNSMRFLFGRGSACRPVKIKSPTEQLAGGKGAFALVLSN